MPCEYPDYEITDMESLILAFSHVIEAWEVCAAKIDAVRQYIEEVY